MELIKKLSEMIEDELEGAEEYAKCALKHKESNPELAQTFYTMSAEEMQHVDRLHKHVVRLIEMYRKEHGEPPEAMQALYDYVHERQIERTNKVAMLQAQFKR